MRDDATLVELAVQGDSTAFAELYERYFDRVFDFLARMVRDQSEAADLAQDTFLRAMNSLGSLAKGASFKSWLFTIARNTALNRIERSSRLQPLQGRSDDDDEPTFDVVDSDRFGNPEEAVEASALAAFVWEAAKGLDPAQYAVLDLTVRQGLDSAEVAGVLGVTKNNAYVMVNRMKKGLEDAVGALMLFKAGRGACPELDASLARLELGEMSPEARRLIDRHASKCKVCGEKKRKMTSPFAIFGGFAMVSPPLGAKASILEGLMQSYPYAAAGAGAGNAEASHGTDGINSPDNGFSSQSATGNPTTGTNAPQIDGGPVAPLTHTGNSGGGGMSYPKPAPLADDDDGHSKSGLFRLALGAAAILIIGLVSFVAVSSQDADPEGPAPLQALASSPTASATTTPTADAATPVDPEATVDPAATVDVPATVDVAAIASTPKVPTPAAAQPGPTQPAFVPPPAAPTATPDAGGAPGGEGPGIVEPECTPLLTSNDGVLEFPAGVSSLTMQLSGATCGEAVAYSASSGAGWLSIIPASGQVPAGGSVAITLKVDRNAIPASGASTTLQISGPVGTLSLPVRVYPNPTFTLPTRTPTQPSLTIRPTLTPTPPCSSANCQ